MAKVRLDQLVVDRGFAPNRTRAQALILAGTVYSGERRLEKSGTPVAADLDITIRDKGEDWVSRGAHKLVHGLDRFEIDPKGLIGLDIGASTGGFTEVLRRREAAKVYAVDVGYGQLHERLRADPGVVVLERTNARHLDRTAVPEPVDLVVCDASFIGLRTVLPVPLALAKHGAYLVALIKPQFEVGRERVGKGGVVRDALLHEEVCQEIAAWLRDSVGSEVLGIEPSPILGPKGNREFLIGAKLGGKQP